MQAAVPGNASLDLRPLSFAEILDRAFSLYRRRFVLFCGIAAIAEFPSLAVVWLPPSAHLGVTAILLALGGYVIALACYLFAQGASIVAIADVYLGRPATIKSSFARVSGHLAAIFGAVALSGLAIGVGALFFVIPGLFLLARLCLCIPAAVIEQRGPADALSRSFHLTKDYAWRALGIFAVTFVLSFIVIMFIALPYGVAFAFFTDPLTRRIIGSIYQVTSNALTALVRPIGLIATAIYYFDLRVRKEAFDLQFMLDPESESRTRDGRGLSIVS